MKRQQQRQQSLIDSINIQNRKLKTKTIILSLPNQPVIQFNPTGPQSQWLLSSNNNNNINNNSHKNTSDKNNQDNSISDKLFQDRIRQLSSTREQLNKQIQSYTNVIKTNQQQLIQSDQQIQKLKRKLTVLRINELQLNKLVSIYQEIK